MTVALTLTATIPQVARVNDVITLPGHVRHAPRRARVALEAETNTPAGAWQVLAKVKPSKHGRFELSWRVTGPADRQLTLRVVALKQGRVLASSASSQMTVGPARVICQAAAPPHSVPPGDGWITGGLYGEGGAYPGMDACISYAYTLTVTDTQGNVVASQNVAPRQSYTVVLAPGSYTLSGSCGRGTATVTAGRQTTANMYCLYP